MWGRGIGVYYAERAGVLIVLLAGGDKVVAATRHGDRNLAGQWAEGVVMGKAVVKSKAAAVPRTRTLTYDVAEQLRTPEEMAAYLDAWLEEAPEDVAGITRALGDIARAKGMSQVARDAGLSRESLYRALSEDGNPSFATVLKVARALGVKFHAQAA